MVAFDPLVEGTTGNPENSCSLTHLAPGPNQDGREVAPLRFLKGLVGCIARRRGLSGRRPQREVGGADLGPAGQQRHPRDDVLELPKVAGP